MSKFFLMLSFCLLSSPIMAETVYGAKMATQERVINLPNDGGKWYVSVFGDTNSQRCKEITSWFNTHDGLRNLKSQTHFNVYSKGTLEYQKYKLPGELCVRVQTNKGVVSSEFWNDNIPMTPDALYAGICGDIKDKTSWGCIFRRRCRPQPQPSPEPGPEPTPIISTPEPTPPVLEPVNNTVDAVVVAVLCLVSVLIGGGIGIGQSVAKEFASKK